MIYYRVKNQVLSYNIDVGGKGMMEPIIEILMELKEKIGGIDANVQNMKDQVSSIEKEVRTINEWKIELTGEQNVKKKTFNGFWVLLSGIFGSVMTAAIIKVLKLF
jgi:hypothetical protein